MQKLPSDSWEFRYIHRSLKGRVDQALAEGWQFHEGDERWAVLKRPLAFGGRMKG